MGRNLLYWPLQNVVCYELNPYSFLFVFQIYQPLLCPELCCWGGHIWKRLQDHHQLHSQNWQRRGGEYLFYLRPLHHAVAWVYMSKMSALCPETDVSLSVFQLCFDYQFDTVEGQHKIACHCGAPECRKWINWGKTKTTNLNAFLAIVCICCDLCTEKKRLHTKVISWMSRRPEPLKRWMNLPVASSWQRRTNGWRKGNVTQ